MKLVNNTPGQVEFSITSPGHGDCGTIDAGGTSDWPKYDNQEEVRVSFGTKGPQFPPYKITIPDIGPGMAVTIGLFKV